MRFGHSAAVWREHPDLVAGVLAADGIRPGVSLDLEPFTARAAARLTGASESDLPEIQAWRRTFARMGLKPTQYRCAAEALLRRFRKEGSLPRIHPLIDLCNAASLAYAIPVAVFDRSRIEGDLEVRPAGGDERYTPFAGEDEAPATGEIVFADDGGRVHARRWTNRQSGWSAVREETRSVLVVAEALHATARDDVASLVAELAAAIEDAWHFRPATAVLAGPSWFEA